MCRGREYSRLYHLIDGSLRPYTESELVSLTKDNEKDLLLLLSQVLREIQLLTNELDRNCENEIEMKPACDGECSDDSNAESENNCFLDKIVAVLMVLLTVESRHVQHLASNVLVVVSEFVAASGSNWDSFIHLLFVCLKLALSNTLSYSLEPSTTASEDSNCGLSSFDIVLKPRLKTANWFTVAGIIRALRNILKSLKEEYDDQFVKAYLNSVSSSLSNLPWDLLNEIHVVQNGDAQKSFCSDTLLLRNVWCPASRIVFLGNIVQFFCSLVEQSVLVEVLGDSSEKHQVLCKISNLIPELLYWCLGKQGDCNDTRISHYFRHKLLMLMIRLSSQNGLECSILVSWLQLLHKYFQDLLWQPITQLSQDDCLEGSPFLLSVFDGVAHSISSRHSQRQAVFLFLRCSFTLISLREETDEQCACATRKSCLTSDLSLDLECCSRKKGLLELYKWLQGHLPTDMFVNCEMYLEECMHFALSFLRLYMHEDDILFEVLLQLFSVPFCAEQHCCKEGRSFLGLKEDILFHVSSLFNPVHLFHLFLAELHYDHQVLLDYLISKDTGINCAEYLLRCLRTVCDSWHLFAEFSGCGKVSNQSSCKKRKVFLDGFNSQVELSSAPAKGDVIAESLEEVRERDNKYSSKHCRSRGQPFKEAKQCLLSLKSSVENLHQKNLFPYNPEVLLRRLMRFQELSLKQEKYQLSENGGTN